MTVTPLHFRRLHRCTESAIPVDLPGKCGQCRLYDEMFEATRKAVAADERVKELREREK